ncbi:MAG TPA: CHAD domain-containing protein [Gaiellaceae bacterium]|nr:CHAD domain-containing protein [Gaiellaceae bacterium]
MRAVAEYERKLDAPVGFRLPPLGGRPLEPRSFTSVYYDVPGGSLATAGITLRRRIERRRSLWQLKLPSNGFRLELEEAGGPGRAPEKLRRLLRAHLRRGPLERVAELRTRRSGELVARNGTRAEVTLDEVSIMDARRVRDRFVEVELELRSGNPAQLDLLAREVVEAGAQRGAELPKLFRALVDDVNREAEPESPLEALRARLGEQAREIEAHDPGTRLGRDPESLHDMRVAVRRTRALLRAGRSLTANDTEELEGLLQELGQALGAVRDLDVLSERLRAEATGLPDDARQAFQPLLRQLGRERSAARRRLLRTLDADAYLDLLDLLERTVSELRPSGDETTLAVLAERQAKKLQKLARSLPNEPSDEQLHELRKAGKRTRYAAELAGKTRVVRRAKRLQDVLGEHQDAVVAGRRLRELAAGAEPEQAFAAGRLAEREDARRAEVRGMWAKAWKRLRQAL